MGNDVFANGREVACKAADGKAIAAFPDVAFTPPQTPATPPGVPIPYPNTAMASDTTKGSKKVKISGKEVMLKNQSYFKTSSGDEAGSAPKKGVVTSKTKGKVYFNMWSMDVKFEGQNVVRHLDLTTHNHGSTPGNSPPWAYTDSQATSPIKGCEEETAAVKSKCEEKGLKTKEQQCADEGCKDAKRCLLITYNQGKRKGAKSQVGCCKGEQPHHLVEAHCFYEVGKRGDEAGLSVSPPAGKEAYKDTSAPCVCAEGPRHTKEHGQYHAFQGTIEAKHHKENEGWKYKDARKAGVNAQSAVNPQCSSKCTETQLDAYHKDECGMNDETPLRTDKDAGTRSGPSNAENLLTDAQKEKLATAVNNVLGGTRRSGGF